jgi:hypothetical protein
MSTHGIMRITKRFVLVAFALLSLSLGALSWADDNAAALKDRYDALAPQLKSNVFHRPIHLDSEETSNSLKGDIYAVVDYPFATVNSAFNDPQQGPANWCEVLILHLNTKYCHASAGSNGAAVINMNVGKKTPQELGDTYRVQFNYRSVATSPDYFQVDLSAATGPLSTKDYRIMLEAVDIGKGRTFLHLTYSYGFGAAGRIAMKTYLATIGSAKVGFTQASGDYIGGVRGLVERNTMRYYLAIDAYLASLSLPAGKRVDQRFATWFDATEQYPRQLHELDRQEYLQMKKDEYQRQQTAQ